MQVLALQVKLALVCLALICVRAEDCHFSCVNGCNSERNYEDCKQCDTCQLRFSTNYVNICSYGKYFALNKKCEEDNFSMQFFYVIILFLAFILTFTNFLGILFRKHFTPMIQTIDYIQYLGLLYFVKQYHYLNVTQCTSQLRSPPPVPADCSWHQCPSKHFEVQSSSSSSAGAV